MGVSMDAEIVRCRRHNLLMPCRIVPPNGCARLAPAIGGPPVWIYEAIPSGIRHRSSAAMPCDEFIRGSGQHGERDAAGLDHHIVEVADVEPVTERRSRFFAKA